MRTHPQPRSIPTILAGAALMCICMLGSGCTPGGNGGKASTPQWTLIRASGGISGGEITPDFDGIRLTDTRITYFSGRHVLRTAAITYEDWTPPAGGPTVHLLVIAGDNVSYEKILTASDLTLRQFANDGYSYEFVAATAN